MSPDRIYLPAAGHHWALPFYDPLVRLLGLDAARNALLDQAAVGSSHRVLDIGCGTGSLAVLLKTRCPGADVVGLDPDPKALARARRKAGQAGLVIHFDQGFSDEQPYPPGSFDRVFSSFMFHHLETETKVKTVSEVRRVLKPGGSFHMLDFGGPEDRTGGLFARLIHSRQRRKDNAESRILTLMSQGGLAGSKKVVDRAVFFGTLRFSYYRASAPAAVSDSGQALPKKIAGAEIHHLKTTLATRNE